MEYDDMYGRWFNMCVENRVSPLLFLHSSLSTNQCDIHTIPKMGARCYVLFFMVLLSVQGNVYKVTLIIFRVVPQALGQSQDRPGASTVNSTDMGKIVWFKSQGNNKVWTVCICGMLNPSRPFTNRLPVRNTFHIIPSTSHVEQNAVLLSQEVIGLVYVEVRECHWLFTVHPNSDVPCYLAVCIQPEIIVSTQFTCNAY